MPNTNSWLCIYAIAQVGRPYWFACAGEISTPELYVSRVVPNGYTYDNYMEQLGVKVHDCSGLILGALTCEDVNGEPCKSAPVEHSATKQYNRYCKSKGSRSTFPKVPGTLVFTSKGDNKSHVGIYVGNVTTLDGRFLTNQVVEAQKHATGVVYSDYDAKVNNKYRWDSWGQLECCNKDTESSMHFNAQSILQPASAPISVAGTTKVEIQTQNTTPYIATVLEGRDPKLDYTKIRDARISGMMFYGGALYDLSHMKQTYTNPKLAHQVQQCKDAGMPFALYVYVRARTMIEADAECRALYYMISRYSPKLGLWLTLQTGASKDTNDKILDVYYKYIEKWGLKARCGLYVTPDQLNTITWTSFQDKFYLWMIEPMKATEVDDELLNPDMFEVPD